MFQVKSLKNFDFLIPILVFVISLLGLTIIFSLEFDLFFRQLTFLLIGFLLFFLFSRIDLRIFENIPWLLYFGSLLLLILTFPFGQVARGATRWFSLGNFVFQPSEIIKPFLILFFASLLVKPQNLKPERLFFVFLLVFLPVFLIFKQPDLGSSLVVLSSFIGILIISGVGWRYLLTCFLGASSLLPLAWHFLADYQKSRILAFLFPGLDVLGAGYNQLQAVITVSSGKIFGRGLGKGTQSHLAFLPEHQTDFIFASFTEELGLVGALLLLFFYGLLLFRILRVIRKTSSSFGRLVCSGIFFMLCFQVFVNVGMNIGIVPIAGVTLPFVSVGGSSIISWMICLGLVEAAAFCRQPEDTLEIR